MMTDIQQFKALQQHSARSFHQQKVLIKKLLAGQQVQCQACKQSLTIHLPGENNAQTGIKCQRGCTDIALDFS